MEIIEENPLRMYIDEQNSTVGFNYKNNVGRPKKCSEIQFSSPPKSIMSILLSKERNENDERKMLSKEVIESPVQQNKTTNNNNEIYSEGTTYNQTFKKLNAIIQRNKIYQCNHFDCAYSTKFPSNLKVHKRIHIPDQQYICDECTFRSKFVSSLKTHKRLHRSERPFVCKSCDYKCNSQSNLKKHISRKHLKI